MKKAEIECHEMKLYKLKKEKYSGSFRIKG